MGEKDINKSLLSGKYPLYLPHIRGKYSALAVWRIEKRYLAEINLKTSFNQTGIIRKEARKCFSTSYGIAMPEYSV